MKKNEPVFTRTLLDGCIFNPLQADERCRKRSSDATEVGGPERRHMGPLGGLADDKVTRLRVNLCYYLRLIIVSGLLVPTELPAPFHDPLKHPPHLTLFHAAHREESIL